MCELSWKVKFGYGCLGTLIGVSVFLSFFHLDNEWAGIWGLASSIFAFSYAIYIWNHLRPKQVENAMKYMEQENVESQLVTSTTPLKEASKSGNISKSSQIFPSIRERACFAFGSIGVLTSIVFFVMYITVASLDSDPLNATSRWMDAVWSFMTFKWSFAFAYQVHRYNSSLLNSH